MILLATWLHDLAAVLVIGWSFAIIVFLGTIARRGKFYIGVRHDDDES